MNAQSLIPAAKVLGLASSTALTSELPFCIMMFGRYGHVFVFTNRLPFISIYRILLTRACPLAKSRTHL
jgi:hypothetical protein